jgi:hypothetical protein
MSLDRARLRMGSYIPSVGAAPALTATPAAGGAAPTASIVSARVELGEATRGRVSLAVLNFIILAMLGFYVWQRGSQGSGG